MLRVGRCSTYARSVVVIVGLFFVSCEHASELLIESKKAIQEGDLESALKTLEVAKSMFPQDAEVHFFLGFVLQQNQHRLRDAVDSFARASNFDTMLKLDALYNTGICFERMGDYHSAANWYMKACQRLVESDKFGGAEALKDKGKATGIFRRASSTLARIGDQKNALSHFSKGLEIDPNDFEMLSNKGIMLDNMGLFDEAAVYLSRAIKVEDARNRRFDVMKLLVGVYRRARRFQESYDIALKLNEAYKDGWRSHTIDMGHAQLGMHDKFGAMELYHKAFHGLVKEDGASLFWSAASEANDGGMHKVVVDIMKIPCMDWGICDSVQAGATTMAVLMGCHWNYYNAAMAMMKKVFQRISSEGLESHARMAHAILPTSIDAELLRDGAIAHAKYLERMVSRNHIVPHLSLRSHQRVRMAYLSGAGFHKTPGSSMARPLFQHHDRTVFEVHCYAFRGEVGVNALRRNITAECEYFHEYSHILDDSVAAEKINAGSRPHFAVDLTGVTGFQRTGVLAHVVAPVQVSMLEYPFTMGASYIHYIVTDPTASPPEMAHLFTEKHIMLQESYIINDYLLSATAPVKLMPKHKPRTNAPLGSVLLCSLNQGWKVQPHIFDIWMKIMRRISNAYLMMRKSSEDCGSTYSVRAYDAGISTNRLILDDGKLPYEEHLERLSECDIFLDTPAYNAHTAASDAIWSGVPIVTLAEETMVSRGAASLLVAANAPMLISHSLSEYENMIVMRFFR